MTTLMFLGYNNTSNRILGGKKAADAISETRNHMKVALSITSLNLPSCNCHNGNGLCKHIHTHAHKQTRESLFLTTATSPDVVQTLPKLFTRLCVYHGSRPPRHCPDLLKGWKPTRATTKTDRSTSKSKHQQRLLRRLLLFLPLHLLLQLSPCTTAHFLHSQPLRQNCLCKYPTCCHYIPCACYDYYCYYYYDDYF